MALKLPKELNDRLLKNKIAVPLRYFPKGPIKKAYVLFPNGIERGGKALHQYVKASIAYVLTLPKPKTKQPVSRQS